MEDLVAESIPLDIVKILDILEVGRVLRDKGALLQERGDVGEVGLLGELLDIVVEGFLGDTGERVLDPEIEGGLWSAVTSLMLMRIQLMPDLPGGHIATQAHGLESGASSFGVGAIDPGLMLDTSFTHRSPLLSRLTLSQGELPRSSRSGVSRPPWLRVAITRFGSRRALSA